MLTINNVSTISDLVIQTPPVRPTEQYSLYMIYVNDNSSVMLPGELRKVQRLEWPVGDAM